MMYGLSIDAYIGTPFQRFFRFLLCAAVFCIFFGNHVKAGNPNPDWVLVFSDDFNASSFSGKKLKWNKKWNKIEYLPKFAPAWRQHQSKVNSLVVPGRDGKTTYVRLKGVYGKYKSQSCLKGDKETFACGGIFTDKTFAFKYGYVEVRARFDCYKGVWPAIWLMPVGGGWPNSGEIDIMEHINHEKRVWQSIHMLRNSGSGDGCSTIKPQPPINNVTGWHTYGVEWAPGRISFYVDGKKTGTFTPNGHKHWPFDKGGEFYILIDQQIGGKWPAPANPAELKKNSANFDVDYVLVYSTAKSTPSAEICPGWSANGPLESNGSAISYNKVDGVNSGNLDFEAGNYHVEVKGNLGRILGAGSNIKLTTDAITT